MSVEITEALPKVRSPRDTHQVEALDLRTGEVAWVSDPYPLEGARVVLRDWSVVFSPRSYEVRLVELPCWHCEGKGYTGWLWGPPDFRGCCGADAFAEPRVVEVAS